MHPAPCFFNSLLYAGLSPFISPIKEGRERERERVRERERERERESESEREPESE